MFSPTNPPNVFKVVVAVDVQNCFLFATENENANFLNLDPTTIRTSEQVTREISDLVKDIKPNACVFTRDLHPMNHLSFMEDEGREFQKGTTWPRHCRNPTTKCKKREGTSDIADDKSKPAAPKPLAEIIDNSGEKYIDTTISKYIKSANLEPMSKYITDNDKDHLENGYLLSKTTNSSLTASDMELYNLLSGLKIRGNEISYLFYSTDLLIPCLMLNMGNKTGQYKIGLQTENDEVIGPATMPQLLEDTKHGIIKQPENCFEFEVNKNGIKTKFVALTKGERCDQESYSAFNYHLAYELDNTDKKKVNNAKPPAFDKSNSTGLWEWILANKGNATNIEIYVCGLVGNVCVIQSVLQGMAMWDNVYRNNNTGVNVKFIFSLLGTRFTTALPPGVINPYGIATQTIMDEKDIPTHMINWISQINSFGLLNNIVEKQDYNYDIDVYFKKPNENAQNIKISGVLTMPPPPPPAPAAGGKRRTRKIKYCKICKGSCKKKHAKNRRNLCKTRRR